MHILINESVNGPSRASIAQTATGWAVQSAGRPGQDIYRSVQGSSEDVEMINQEVFSDKHKEYANGNRLSEIIGIRVSGIKSSFLIESFTESITEREETF